jgi:hypothetical protein
MKESFPTRGGGLAGVARALTSKFDLVVAWSNLRCHRGAVPLVFCFYQAREV